MSASERPPAGRVDNGLRAPGYVPLADVDAVLGARLLAALGRARIAAYLADPDGAAAGRRLFVDAAERGDARSIVAAALRAAAGSAGDTAGGSTADVPTADVPTADVPGGDGPAAADGRSVDQPAGHDTASTDRDTDTDSHTDIDTDTDTAFRALVADWRVDTVAAVREAERALSREDADWRLRLSRPQARDEVWLDEDHYVPPAPPPLPKLARPTLVAMAVLAGSLLVLVLGDLFGLGDRAAVVVGIAGMLIAAGILLSRVGDHHRDQDDDGSAV